MVPIVLYAFAPVYVIRADKHQKERASNKHNACAIISYGSSLSVHMFQGMRCELSLQHVKHTTSTFYCLQCGIELAVVIMRQLVVVDI